MRVIEQTLREQSDGNVRQVPPLRFMDRGMRMVVGGLEAQNKNGLRVSVTGGEALALLFEISTGRLLSLMGYPFSSLRISATVGLAIDRLTRPDAKTVGDDRQRPFGAGGSRTGGCGAANRKSSRLQPKRGKSRSLRARRG